MPLHPCSRDYASVKVKVADVGYGTERDFERSPTSAYAHAEYDTQDNVTPGSYTIPLLVTGIAIIESAMRENLPF